MTLDDYLKQQNITEAAFAGVIGVHQSSVHRIRKGAMRPDIETLARIVAATNGEVTLIDFVPNIEPGSVCALTHTDESGEAA